MAKSMLLIIFLAIAFMLIATGYAGDVTVGINEKTAVHKSSGGVTTAFPDVCKTPSPAGPVSVPYPNTGKSSDVTKGSKKVKMGSKEILLKNKSLYRRSSGDEAGSYFGKAKPEVNPEGNLNRPRPKYYNYLRKDDN